MNPVRLSVALLGALALPSSAHAQRVIADISIHDGPVTGRVIVGHPPVYREPTVVVVAPPRWRPVRVYRAHRAHDWYRTRGYRDVRIWYDPHRDFYYDEYHRGLIEVSVYQHGGHYYRNDWQDNGGWYGRDGRDDNRDRNNYDGRVNHGGRDDHGRDDHGDHHDRNHH